MSGLCPTRYTSGANYELWNYCWYTTADERNNPSRSGFAADMLGTKNRGVYVRKRSDDLIWALVFMCLLITAVVISRDSDDRQLLTWRYGMRKYC